jgi:hypothetical protein
MVDSAEAVQLSTAAYLARFPEYPVQATEVRTDGRDWYVTLQPDTLVLGGGGIIRVTPRRKAKFVVLYQ